MLHICVSNVKVVEFFMTFGNGELDGGALMEVFEKWACNGEDKGLIV